MTTTGVDYAWGRPGGAALQSAGVQFAMRYLSNDPSKNLTADELADLAAHGVAAGLVWETTARRAAAGWQAGHDDATRAAAQRSALGMASTPIYAAVDFDVIPSEMPAVVDYFRGWNSVLSAAQTGVYGGFRAVDGIRAAGLAAYGWQTTAWSGGQWSGYAQLQQRGGTVTIGGVSCDRNTAAGSVGDVGAYLPGSNRPAPKPPTPAPAFPGRVLELRSPRMSGPDVRALQQQLARRGWRIAVDGVYGPASRAVVVAFQQDSTAHGWPLKADGEAGELTWRAAFLRPVS